MTTECNQEPFPFHPLNQREVRGQFDGGSITSDAGGLLLREVEKRTNIIGQFASCFTDYRDPELVEHGVAELVAQRIYGLALGYEDLNDHEELRRDPLLAVLVEKEDVTGEERRRARDQGTALAGKSTLNRMELGAAKLGETERYKKIILDEDAVDRVLARPSQFGAVSGWRQSLSRVTATRDFESRCSEDLPTFKLTNFLSLCGCDVSAQHKSEKGWQGASLLQHRRESSAELGQDGTAHGSVSGRSQRPTSGGLAQELGGVRRRSAELAHSESVSRRPGNSA